MSLKAFGENATPPSNRHADVFVDSKLLYYHIICICDKCKAILMYNWEAFSHSLPHKIMTHFMCKQVYAECIQLGLVYGFTEMWVCGHAYGLLLSSYSSGDVMVSW